MTESTRYWISSRSTRNDIEDAIPSRDRVDTALRESQMRYKTDRYKKSAEQEREADYTIGVVSRHRMITRVYQDRKILGKDRIPSLRSYFYMLR